MNAMIILCLLLVAVYVAERIAMDLVLIICEWKKANRPEEKAKRQNHIVINGRMYYPNRVGRATDCKTECPLYAHCDKGSHSICMALQHCYDDVIMVEDDGE